jgi:DNA replication protein DnaC
MPTSSKANPTLPGLDLYDDDACPICGGYGVVSYDVPVDDPRFGKAYPCPRCGEETHRELRRQSLRKLSNLDAHQDAQFINFETTLEKLTTEQQSSLVSAKMICENYAADPSGWLVLQGSYGCGKTHLAAAIANTCLDRGTAVLFMTTPDLLDHLRSTFGPSSEVRYDQLYDRVSNVDLLVLDDLGSESPTAWAMEKLYQIINHRYAYRLPTVITTNVPLDSIEARIRSRLIDQGLTRSVKIKAPDYRRGGFSQEENALTNMTLYSDMRFDTWHERPDLTRKDQDNLRRVVERAWHFAESPSGWLVLTGTYGSGKTHLAAAIANYRQFEGDVAMFVTVPDLLDHLRATFNPSSNVTYDRLFNEIRNAPLLVLDDLGVENASPWAQEKLFQIIDHRYRARLATVFTMSRTLDDIDARLASRMGDPGRSTVMAITAPSYRGKKSASKSTNPRRRNPRRDA